MPNTFIENREAWLRMSDIDYVGQFVKAWLAFNAWYRSAYTETQDRRILNEFKWQSNPVLNTLRPKLEATSDDAAQFRAEIGLLHQRLEHFELLAGKEPKKRISLRNVFLRASPPIVKTDDRYGFLFRVELLASKQVTVSVTRKKHGTGLVQMPAAAHDPTTLTTSPGFRNLSTPQKNVLRRLYAEASPLWCCDLTSYEDPEPNTPALQCGAYQFRCGKDVLFAAVAEVLYEMRCTLFHGELAPTKEAVVCYEPAFRLVRRFLDCVV
jgi:hypothetical protein